MGASNYSHTFKRDVVRIALTSGLARRQVADDRGVGMSLLNKWITAHRKTDVVSKEDLSLARENDRLRREVRAWSLPQSGEAWVTQTPKSVATSQQRTILSRTSGATNRLRKGLGAGIREENHYENRALIRHIQSSRGCVQVQQHSDNLAKFINA